MLSAALAVVLVVWSGLALGQRLQAPAVVSFGVVTLLVCATRRAPPTPRLRPLSLLLGLAAGFLGYPAWLFAIGTAGAFAGLPTGEPPASAAGGDLQLWFASVFLAPVFEELLYRERLLSALRPHVGTGGAVVLSSAAFAVSHVDPWAIFGTFPVGVFLGCVYAASGSAAVCIALHIGFNAAAWAGPAGWIAPLPLSAALNLALVGLALIAGRPR